MLPDKKGAPDDMRQLIFTNQCENVFISLFLIVFFSVFIGWGKILKPANDKSVSDGVDKRWDMDGNIESFDVLMVNKMATDLFMLMGRAA